LPLVIAALGLLTSFALASPAQADKFGLDQPNNLVSGVGGIPDNFTHTYCFRGAGWTAARQNLVHGRMQNLDTQTSYTDLFPPPPGCFATTDVWFELNSTMSARGDYICRVWNNGVDGVARSGDDRCEGATIRINSRAGVLTSNHQWRKTICHEIGHSVGLAHGSTTNFFTDCMINGAVPEGLQWEQYNLHHRNHANSRTPSAA
jgi:hypothetical protein